VSAQPPAKKNSRSNRKRNLSELIHIQALAGGDKPRHYTRAEVKRISSQKKAGINLANPDEALSKK
jgi:hypothetical protein